MSNSNAVSVNPLTILNSVIQVAGLVSDLYRYTLNAMDLIEASNRNMAGKDKLSWVMAFVRDFAFNLEMNWPEIEQDIITFISAAKNIYNLAVALKK